MSITAYGISKTIFQLIAYNVLGFIWFYRLAIIYIKFIRSTNKPVMATNLTLPKQRITSIDSLRGFALAGIVIAHMIEEFVGGVIPENVETSFHTGVFDYIAEGFMQIFIRGKFYTLFSFLFGISFFIMMDQAAKKGSDFRWRFIWRLVILLFIGLIHSAIYRGDILTVYVVIGFILPLFYRVPNKWLISFAVVLLLGAGRFLIFKFMSEYPLFGLDFINSSSPEALAYWNNLTSGTWMQIANDNITNGLLQKINFQFGVFGRGYQTLAFFLLGLLAGRIRIFEKIADFQQSKIADNLEKKDWNIRNDYPFKKQIFKTMYWSIGLTIVFIVATMAIFANAPQPVKFDNIIALSGLTAMDLMNGAMTILFITGFILIFNKKRKSVLQALAPYGRTALTNYVLQSIIGTFIFYSYGLGYVGKMPVSIAFLISFVIIAIQMYVSKLWLQYFYYGPLEWIWRCLTHFKVFPFVRKTEEEIKLAKVGS